MRGRDGNCSTGEGEWEGGVELRGVRGRRLPASIEASKGVRSGDLVKRDWRVLASVWRRNC